MIVIAVFLHLLNMYLPVILILFGKLISYKHVMQKTEEDMLTLKLAPPY